MRVLIFGARGYLGRHFRTLYPDAATPETDIADPVQVARALDEARPGVVINAAGKTGRPNIDWCEDHREETLRSNVTGPLVLVEQLARRRIYGVQLSSGCIYQGDKGGQGFAEDDPPNFAGSFYARCKAHLEGLLRDFPVLVLRLRMPFDGSLHERNLLTKLRRYRRVLDAPNSLTCVPDFLQAAQVLIERRRTGPYHLVNPGAVSPYEIMQLYREEVDPSHPFERLAPEELPQVARAGRSNCLLSTAKLQAEGLDLPPVRQSLRRALRELWEALWRARGEHRSGEKDRHPAALLSREGGLAPSRPEVVAAPTGGNNR